MKNKMFQKLSILFCVLAALFVCGAVSAEAADWRDDAAATLAGEGTQLSPYLIGTAQELGCFANWVTGDAAKRSAYYSITADIDLGGRKWTPVGSSLADAFGGTLDGDGHYIANMSVEVTGSQSAGFFGILAGNIQNLSFIDCSVSGENTAGVLAGELRPSAAAILVSNVAVNGGNVEAAQNSGGLIGHIETNQMSQSALIETCSSSASVRVDTESPGGLIGRIDARNASEVTVTGSYATGDVTLNGTAAAHDIAGGLIGNVMIQGKSVNLANCFSTGTVSMPSAGSNMGGGLIGYVNVGEDSDPAALHMYRCYSLSEVDVAGGGAGGLIGALVVLQNFSGRTVNIRMCYSAGDVKNTVAPIGGFIGSIELDAYTDFMADCSGIAGNFWLKDGETNAGLADGVGNNPTDSLNALPAVVSTARSSFDRASAITDLEAAGWAFTNVWGYTDLNNRAFPVLYPFHQGSGVTVNSIPGTFTHVFPRDYSLELGGSAATMNVYPLNYSVDPGALSFDGVGGDKFDINCGSDGVIMLTALEGARNGVYKLKFSVNGYEQLTTAAVSVKVKPDFNGGNLPDGQVDTAYDWDAPKPSTGGDGVFTYTLKSGNLPPGLTLASGGTLSGTPTTEGRYEFIVTVTDGDGQTADAAFILNIISHEQILFVGAELTGGQAGTAYTGSVPAATGGRGDGTFTYTVASGNLPPGLTLAADGTLSGTPTAAGIYAFSVTATGSDGQSVTAEFSLTIGAEGEEIRANPVSSSSLKGKLPLILNPGQTYEVSVESLTENGQAADPAVVLDMTVGGEVPELVDVLEKTDESIRFKVLSPQEAEGPKGARGASDSGIYGSALINITAKQGSVPMLDENVQVVVAEPFAHEIALANDALDAFFDINGKLASSNVIILPGNGMSPTNGLPADWYLVESIDDLDYDIKKPNNSLLPECFVNGGKDAADFVIAESTQPDKKALLPLTYRVTLSPAELTAVFGAEAADGIMAEPLQYLDVIFEKIVIHKEIKQGEYTGYFTNLVAGILQPQEAVDLGMLEVTGGSTGLVMNLSYFVLDDEGLSFNYNGWLIVPDGEHDGQIVDPIWVNKWDRQSGGSTTNIGGGTGGGGCNTGVASALLILLVGVTVAKFKRR